jgi:hypothetical protein
MGIAKRLAIEINPQKFVITTTTSEEVLPSQCRLE